MVEIRGSGPIGLAFALLLLRQGVPAARISIDIGQAAVPDGLGLRTIALGQGSWQLLARLCALPVSAPIRSVEVSMLGHAGRTHIDADQMGAAALGQVTRYRDLLNTLHAAASAAGLGPVSGAEPACIVHAEGRIEDDAQTRDFGQVAILAEVNAAGGQAGTAFERFTDEGPLAMLPLPEPNRYGLVWCASPPQSAQRLAMTDAQFAHALARMLGPRFTHPMLASARSAAPLVRRARRHLVGDGEVWIGNAAQALHPVAGQGLNLGMRDAFVLARALGVRTALDDRVAAQAALAGYARARARDRNRLLRVTDLLAQAFTWPALRPAESVALALLDGLPPVRNALAEQLMFGTR